MFIHFIIYIVHEILGKNINNKICSTKAKFSLRKIIYLFIIDWKQHKHFLKYYIIFCFIFPKCFLRSTQPIRRGYTKENNQNLCCALKMHRILRGSNHRARSDVTICASQSSDAFLTSFNQWRLAAAVCRRWDVEGEREAVSDNEEKERVRAAHEEMSKWWEQVIDKKVTGKWHGTWGANVMVNVFGAMGDASCRGDACWCVVRACARVRANRKRHSESVFCCNVHIYEPAWHLFA